MRVTIFLSPDECASVAELAELRGYSTSVSGAIARFMRAVIKREIAAAEHRLDRGLADVSPTRKHRRELPRAPIAIAHLPRRKPLQTVSKTATNRSARGPQ